MVQKKSLRKLSYHVSGIDETTFSKVAHERLDKIDKYKELLLFGCERNAAMRVIGVPRSTFYRWMRAYKEAGIAGLEPESTRPYKLRKPLWDRATEELVKKIRRSNPIWGKEKINAILVRDHGIDISVSTVGRILDKLLKQRSIQPACVYYGRVADKRSRIFSGHSQRWKTTMKSEKPGQLVQVDHMVIQYKSKTSIRHFKSVCPLTKITVEEAYSTASSTNAAAFLRKMIAEYPFPVESIQVDGGSEFRGIFESECARLGIALFVLPPRLPECNGCIERANSTVKYEFYVTHDSNSSLDALRRNLARYTHKYNTYRPHQALQNLTPMLYFKTRYVERS